MQKHFLLLLIIFISIGKSSFAADRYWAATADSDWNTPANWSDSDGGAVGFSVPIAGDFVYFTATGTGDCILLTATNCDGLDLNGYTGSIDLNANSFNPVVGGIADCDFTGGTITGVTTLTIITSGTLTFSGTTFNNPIDVSGGNIFLNGATFNSTTKFEKTGGGNDVSSGGNTFLLASEVINNSGGRFELGSGSPDNFQSHLVLNNIGTNRLDIARNSVGNTVDGNLTINNTSTSNGDHIRLSVSAASSLTVSGTTTVQNFPSANSNVFLGLNGDVNFVSEVTVTNTPTGANANIYIAHNIDSDVIIGTALINANLIVNNSGAGGNQRIYVGNVGNISIDGSLFLNNSSTATNSQIYCNHIGTAVYNGNISIENTNALSDGVGFGRNVGSSILSAGSTVTISGGGFVSGTLSFRNFTQTGMTAQNITLTGSSILEHYDSDWGGDIFFIAPRHFFRGTRFRGTAVLEKNGGTNDTSIGGNIFDRNAIIRVTGTGRCISSNTVPNDFNSDVTYVQTSTGEIRPTNNCASTYAGDIYVNSSSAFIYLGRGANGRVILDGSIPQSINNLGVLAPQFRDIQTLNSNSEITLNTPITIRVELDLDEGNLISSSTNLIYMNRNSTVSSVSNDAFVDGPLEKIGNNAFTFPIGKNGFYRPAGISAPSNNNARFRAEYFDFDVINTVLSDSVLAAGPMLHISNCEYWTIERTASSNNVEVTLSFDPYNASLCSGVSDPNHLSVALWDGAFVWDDLGNGGTTGGITLDTTSSGTVTTPNVVTSFDPSRPFTLGSLNLGSPLPIQLIEFTATNNQAIVDLFWQTASETDNDYFTLERSADGIDFKEISTQSGAGNSSNVLSYFDVDNSPLNGVSYYRLKQTDFNGEYAYSEIVKVSRKDNSSSQLSVYPNPVNNIINIQTKLASFSISVYSVDGRLINSVKNESIVDMSDYSEGIYNFVITSNEEMINTIKVVKL